MAANVLIIDDSATARAMISLFLKDRQLEVVEAEDAERGLRLARLMPISLVLCDCNLPGMGGLAFVEKVRADSRIGNLPVVLLSADPDLRERARAAGAADFALKPLKQPALNAILARFLPGAAP